MRFVITLDGKLERAQARKLIQGVVASAIVSKAAVEKTELRYSILHLLEKYNEVVTKFGDSRLRVRPMILWRWCRWNIDNVRLRFLRDGVVLEDDRDLQEVLGDAKLLLVLFNVLVDDVADDLHEAELLEALCRIPSAGGSFGEVAVATDYEAAAKSLPERFRPYYDLAADVYVAAGWDELLGMLAADYGALFESMRCSVDLNLRPREVFRLAPDDVARRYPRALGAMNIGEVLAHNANLLAFSTIDLMVLRGVAPDVFVEMRHWGAIDTFRRAVFLSQEMQQIGNSVATWRREATSGDLSNDIFVDANRRVNDRFGREDLLLLRFEEGRRDEVEKLVEFSGAVDAACESWLFKSAERVFLCCGSDQISRRKEQAPRGVDDFVDFLQAARADDDMLASHLLFKGRI